MSSATPEPTADIVTEPTAGSGAGLAPSAHAHVYLLSDLHLDRMNEAQAKEVIRKVLGGDPPAVPQGVLLVPGDIASLYTETGHGRWCGFLAAALLHHEYVIVVLGNHEHYGGLLTKSAQVFRGHIIERLRVNVHESAAERIVFLERETWTHPATGLRVAGCTLWSDIPSEAAPTVKYHIADYCQIRDATVAATVHLFDLSRAWLEDVIAESVPDIVLTHHAPLLNAGCSPPQYTVPGRALTHAFESDLSELVARVPLWCHGHTHHACTVLSGGCRVITNAYGYRGEDIKFEPRRDVFLG